MFPSIYFVRHAQANGQERYAGLTKKGHEDAHALANYFHDKNISRIVSSPYSRAVSTINPAAEMLTLPIEKDERLIERCLSPDPMKNWLIHLEKSFKNDSYKLQGGESSLEAQSRILSVVDSIKENTIIVSHGNLLALYIQSIVFIDGFKLWKQMKNPDVYHLHLGSSTLKKLDWKS
ncbi:histidine phosphatase family protein [Shouchella sp. JSM 1781072]|uniref:histidine phosphatase family protein n=1 Tax=Shouchella sp. JSM 1781072 TaxID=3344581 RepID=UPI0035C1A796